MWLTGMVRGLSLKIKKKSLYGNKTLSKVRDILCESKAGDNYIIRYSLNVCVGRTNIMNVDTCILLKNGINLNQYQ